MFDRWNLLICCGSMCRIYSGILLYKMAFLYTKNEKDALDVVGDTVLKGYLQIKTLKNASLFQTWITRVLINTAHDHRRKAILYR